ncbi:MAG: dihydroorotate dehydrogenase (quinone) [Betaproteobacteria bacterium RIFCSPLOWO2_12_FULL_65_14]|nr:MAG: dihydroorotate dehydrogenase (quinone) [Betaproteobacteria bacterium RIFCSPLOWO2_12_FULL_65_14]
MFYSLARPLLFSLDPETAHNVALGLARFSFRRKAPSAPVRVMGIDFPNPVGAAAGIDKHAEHVDAVAAMGFGFIELGGVTPRPQPGNPRPRLFRLREARGIINRFGLNSIGVDAFVHNLLRARTRAVIGVNVGKNHDTPNERAAQDYERCLEVLYPHVHYMTINVSSPNTKGLRDLQSNEMLTAILKAMTQRRERLRERHGRNVALVVKISPDGDDDGLRIIADVTRRERADGIIATNTTVSREGVTGLPQAKEEGGLSGAPLFRRSTEVLRRLAELVQGEIPLIGGGGIMSGADARAKFDAGASLVQIYSGLVFRGPQLIPECVSAYRRK